jgi:phosphinothricin acetyltransferase
VTRPGLVLGDAGIAEAPAVAAIYAHHVLHGLASFEEVPPHAGEIARRLAERTAQGLPTLLARMGGRPVGFAHAGRYRTRPAYRFTVEDSVYVEAGAEGQGIGRMLLTELVARCTALGCRQMVAIIGDSANRASIGLHERLGFRRAGLLADVGFKHGRWVDSVIMQLSLGPGSGRPPGP